jgi:4-hydroxy-3-polyprenylbenzoate decarboxylase
MPFADLQAFLAELEQRGQLKRIAAEVDPVLEVSAIADRVSKSPAAGEAAPPPTDPVHGRLGGHALLFKNVRGSEMPLAINVYGSYERVKLALGCEDLEELAARVQALVKPEMPATLMGKVRKLPELARLASFPPKSVRSGMCQQVVHLGEQADLTHLPIIKCWPEDGGKYITFGSVVTRHPETGDVNLGMYRIQLFEPRMCALHCHMHHDGARNIRMYRERGERMPVAVVLGGESVLPYAATCPLPPDVSELLMAGFLNGKGIETVKCKTIDLEVPANSEIVIEGYIDPDEDYITEGPFGDHTGVYSLAGQYPRYHVTAITHRKDPVYPTTIVGFPPQEDYYLGKATERVFGPLLRMIVPEVIDYDLPMFGAFHNFAFVKIRKEYPYQARRVMQAIWGAGQMAFTKFIIVVDEHVNVHDEQDVLFHVGLNVDPRRDVVIADGPLDILDHAAPFEGAGSKMGIDATEKIPGEGAVRPWAKEVAMPEEILSLISRRWNEYGL